MVESSTIEGMISKLEPAKLQSLETLLGNAEAFNRLLALVDVMQENGTLDSLVNIIYEVKCLQDAFQEAAVTGAATIAGSLMELGKTVSAPGTKDLLLQVLEREKLESAAHALAKLDELNRTGTLDFLVEGAVVLKCFRDMTTDEAIHSIYTKTSWLMELLPVMTKLVKPLTSEPMTTFLDSVSSAETNKALLNPPRVGMMSFMNKMRDKDVQRFMSGMLIIGKEVGRRMQQPTVPQAP